LGRCICASFSATIRPAIASRSLRLASISPFRQNRTGDETLRLLVQLAPNPAGVSADAMFFREDRGAGEAGTSRCAHRRVSLDRGHYRMFAVLNELGKVLVAPPIPE